MTFNIEQHVRRKSTQIIDEILQSWAAWPLLVTSGITIAFGVAIPYSVVGEYLGFTPLPTLYWPLLIASLLLYASLTQSVTFWLLQRKWI